MKTFFICILSFCSCILGAEAANLSASTVKAGLGKKNGKINLTVSGGNAPFSFAWTGPAGYAASWQNPDSLAAGTYCVTVTDRYCGTATLCVSVGESPNAIAETALPMVGIYPNPFTDYIKLHCGNALQGNVTMRLWDVSGRIIAEQTMRAQNEIFWALPSGLPAGSYVLLLQDEQGRQEHRLLLHQAE